MPKGVTSVSWQETTCTFSSGTPTTSAAIWAKAVSAPWPISVSPSCSWKEPSWFRIMRQELDSREIGQTAVLYQKTERPIPLRISPLRDSDSLESVAGVCPGESVAGVCPGESVSGVFPEDEVSDACRAVCSWRSG